MCTTSAAYGLRCPTYSHIFANYVGYVVLHIATHFFDVSATENRH